MEVIMLLLFLAVIGGVIGIQAWIHTVKVDSLRRDDGSYAYYDYQGIFHQKAKKPKDDSEEASDESERRTEA